MSKFQITNLKFQIVRALVLILGLKAPNVIAWGEAPGQVIDPTNPSALKGRDKR